MGCDGGTIPRRDEMVKVKKKAEKADREAELAAKWRHCALSGEKLKKPIVACDLGRFYNKESLLLALLDKPSLPEVARHVRSLRDVVELRLTSNPTYKSAAMAMAEASQSAEFICPVSGLEMSGRHRFVFIQCCGCVLSEKALKEVPSENCHRCGCGYLKENVVLLNGSEEEVKQQREAMEQRRLEIKQAKMAAKGKRKKATPPAGETSQTSSNSSSFPEGDDPPVMKRLRTDEDAQSSPSPSTTSTLTNGSVKATKKKKSTLPIGASKYARPPSGAAVSSSAAGTELGLGSTATSVVKKTTQELEASFKAANSDPNAREAYKALFYSADKPRPKEKTSNWVTFFPYH